MAYGVVVEDWFQQWCEKVVYLILEGGLVGVYFYLEKKCTLYLFLKEI
jgi:hypothetical protein